MPRKTIKPEKDDTHWGAEGKFTSEQVSKGRGLAADLRSKANSIAKKGERDRGDQPKAKYLPTRAARSPFN